MTIALTVAVLVVLGYDRPTQNPCDHFPASLMTYLHRTLPGYQLIPPQAFDTSWMQNFTGVNETDGAPNCITGDFDGNGLEDFALLLRHGRAVELFAFHRTPDSWHHVRAWTGQTIPYQLPLQLAVFRIQPRVLSIASSGDTTPSTVHIKNPSIELVFFETSSVVLYWNGDRYLQIWTSN